MVTRLVQEPLTSAQAVCRRLLTFAITSSPHRFWRITSSISCVSTTGLELSFTATVCHTALTLSTEPLSSSVTTRGHTFSRALPVTDLLACLRASRRHTRSHRSTSTTSTLSMTGDSLSRATRCRANVSACSCKRLLFPLLRNTLTSPTPGHVETPTLIVSHFLGVDHVGHRYRVRVRQWKRRTGWRCFVSHPSTGRPPCNDAQAG